MAIRFENDSTKIYLARKGPSKVLGKDVDAREQLTESEAIEWFDQVWANSLELAVIQARGCDLEFVRSKIPLKAHSFIQSNAQHREFTLANCFFICQLADSQTCNQLWFIPSASGDPRTLYVRFETVPIKDEFDKLAKKLGWTDPEGLGEKILLDFMESVTKRNFRSTKPN